MMKLSRNVLLRKPLQSQLNRRFSMMGCQIQRRLALRYQGEARVLVDIRTTEGAEGHGRHALRPKEGNQT